ncbi:MAG: FG-GAP repeat protein [Maricaulaceae bacterium]|nr:FG-GAP repeat protein [Maricaulaceae bacterium]
MIAGILVLSGSPAAASCPVPLAGQFSLTYNNGTKFMAGCKYGDSYRNLCGLPGAACTPSQEGDLEYSTAGSVLRYCNGSNWINVQCEALGSCAGVTGGTISADAQQMKYCDGTTWQAMYNDGICTGIGVQEAVFTPTPATEGEDALYFTVQNGLAMSEDYLFASSYFGTRVAYRDGAVTVYKRSGTSWTRLKELAPTSSAAGHAFGSAIAISGDYAIVGACSGHRVHFFKKDHGGADNWGQLAVRTGGSNHGCYAVDMDGTKAIAGTHGFTGAAINQGQARIYRRDRGGADAWGEVTIINHPGTPVHYDYFGITASISGDIAAIGGYGVDEAGVVNAGVIWLYHETSLDNWVLLKKLTNPNGLGVNDYFGYAADIADLDGNGTADRLVISAPLDDEIGGDRGAVFIYERNQGGANNWGLVAQTNNAGAPAGAQYVGWSLRLAGDRIIAGIRLDDTLGTNAGAAAIFRKDAGGANNWGIEQYLHGSGSVANSQQGYTAAISPSGDYATMGSLLEPAKGAVYAFSRSGTTWTERQRIEPSATIEHAVRMGEAIAVSGDYAAVGIPYKTDYWISHKYYSVGGVSIYRRAPNATWSLDKHVLPPSPGQTMQFGGTLDISPEYLVVGVPGDDTVAGDSGGAMIFGRNVGGPGNWGYIKTIKASDAMASDAAGVENGISLFGDYIAIGSGGDDLDLVLPQANAGSLSIFKKDHGGPDNWGQIRKVVPSNKVPDSYFGRSVDMAGTTLVAGARYENNENGLRAGAAYIFERDQGGAENWGEVKRLVGKAANDYFAYDVAVSGDTIAIGSPYDDDAGGDRGAVYIYYRDTGGAGNWGLHKKLLHPGTVGGNALFGLSLDLSGDILIVGAPYDDTNVQDSGYTYVFSRNEGGADNWGLLATIDPDVPNVGDLFGWSVAVSGNVVAAGGIYNDDYGTDDGAVYVFGCPPIP